MKLRVCPATTAESDWLFTLHRSTMGEYIEQTWGWDEQWQREDFAKRLTACEVSIIEADGVRAGARWIEPGEREIYLNELQVLPEWQGRGIGSWILEGLIADAKTSGRALELSVLQVNPRARKLYERLGFVVTDEGDPFIRMRYRS